MNVEDAIKGRRSVRSYSEKDVKHEDLVKVLNAGRYAPSSGNIQNWVFIVVRNEEKKREIAKACLNQIWMVQAPVHIVICNDLVAAKRAYGERGERLYSIQNCAAAAQNMMLQAEELGLATCWVGSFDNEGVKRILNIPSGVNPEIIITLGYKSPRSTSHGGRHNLSHLVFFEDWGNRTIPKGLILERVEEAEKKIVEKVKKEVKKTGIVEKIKKAVKK
ncbi:MAG: nitroreductase family protein [Candidatus Nanoarchaeia archaeon]